MTDETTVTEQVTLETDGQGRTKHNADFSFKVPENHPQHKDDKGNVRQIKKSYNYVQCKNDQQAVATLKAEEWALVDMVNEELKNRARSNAYQKALAPYKTSNVSQEDIRKRMVLDMIRVGVPEDVAERTVKALPVK